VALKVVVLLALGVGATLPHCPDTLHETVQVTPLPDVSPLTVAVIGIVPVAATELPLAETDTVMTGDGTIVDELLPPQPVTMRAEASTRIVQATETLPFIRAPKRLDKNMLPEKFGAHSNRPRIKTGQGRAVGMR
jgi:hypothetical protein